jgi:hypothetical protein
MHATSLYDNIYLGSLPLVDSPFDISGSCSSDISQNLHKSYGNKYKKSLEIFLCDNKGRKYIKYG